MKGFSLTVDGNWVQINDRIVLTGAFYNDDDIVQMGFSGAFYFAKVGLKF